MPARERDEVKSVHQANNNGENGVGMGATFACQAGGGECLSEWGINVSKQQQHQPRNHGPTTPVCHRSRE